MKSDLSIVEISECFPNKYKPVTGEFIFQHAHALSELANVVVIVPLRMIPPKELFSGNPSDWVSKVNRWLSSIQDTKSYNEGKLSIVYFRYVSIPKMFFESSEEDLIEFFYKGKMKDLINSFKPDIIYCHWLRPWARTASNIAKSLTVPFIIDHHEDIPTLKKLFPDKFKKILSVLEEADSIIVHSSQNKSDLMSEDLNLMNIHVTYLGQNFSVENNPKQFSNKLRIACVSHLYESRKNIDVLIKAASLFAEDFNFEIFIAGEGPLRKEYEDLSSSLGIKDKIKFTGGKTQKEIGDLLEQCDLFVLPSYPEAFGIVFIEALAKGLPVITCKGNGGGEELKRLGYPVVLVTPGSSEELSNSIIELSSDKNKLPEMSAKGKQIVNEYFDWDKSAESTISVINEVLKVQSSKFKVQSSKLKD